MLPNAHALCFIAARGGSKRFPRKNVALLNGIPLLAHVIRAAQKAGIFSRVVISTEDDDIRAIAEDEGASVDRRPAHLAGDTVSVAHTLGEFLSRDPGPEPLVACVYPTAVLLTSEMIRGAVAQLASSTAASLIGVSSYNIHPWQALAVDPDGTLRPLFPEMILKRAQEMPKLVGSTGTIYVVRRANFAVNPNFYTTPLIGYQIPELVFVDINVPNDLERAEQLLRLRKEMNGEA